ncbi:type VI secretion system tip protein VgrG [Roseomonas sp. NAR14]|uniref:Type VI secretion system tip protein VgrG n=1 Tax=Roseomonas acroporae TaxID=2937791 RepID=A0A9X2BWN0_9PROT|nr:type VI secretion system tip protein TssI/VgrG [Roseomonas acroporae]MCK8785129.1 type VI secretion system tip protein VgrG [Roseomonas acroporae]
MASGSGGDTLLQEERLLRVTTPLGPDVLILRRLTVHEAISRPFLIEAELISERGDLRPTDLVGKTVTCSIHRPSQPPRQFHGLVRNFSKLAWYGRGYTLYRLQAIPRFWRMLQTADCRIFQNQSVKAILQTLFGEGQVAPVTFGTLPETPRTYCVQYNETDLDFAQRLLDEIGGGYWFQQEAGNHKLMVTGANADFPLVPGEPVTVRAANAGDQEYIDALTEWHHHDGMRLGKAEALDYDMLKPSTPLKSVATTIIQGPHQPVEWEQFLWPGGQTVRPDIDPAKLALEQHEEQAEQVSATGHDPAVFAGGRLKVRAAVNSTSVTNWLITDVVHEAFEESHMAGGGGSGYRSRLTLIPADRTFRHPDPRPRPVMPGLQCAIVTGPAGEEIHTDEHGRIKIRFLWDRKGKRDDNSSCWVRVAQGWAGPNRGMWFLPRVGDEVLVGFVEGDADRPVVLGSLHNAEAKTPFALPANKTQSGLYTRSYRNGTTANANILRFEDKKGQEEVYLHAEKDVTVEVENDRNETIDRDHTETVKRHHTQTVTQNRTSTIEQGDDKLTIKMGNRTEELSMGNDSLTLKMGNLTIKCDLGKVEIEAMQSIELKVGQSSVKLDQMGVTIQGMMVKAEAQIQLQTKGLMAQHNADAMMIVKGGITMIN